jgi:hypothetical protein
MTDAVPPEIPPPEFQPPGEEPYVLNNSLLPMSMLVPPPITVNQYSAMGGGYGKLWCTPTSSLLTLGLKGWALGLEWEWP